MPEPVHDPTAIRNVDLMRHYIHESHRVVLTGWDGDALLNESPKPFFRQLWRSKQYWRLFAGMLGYAIWQRPLGPLAWHDRIRKIFIKPEQQKALFPDWLQPEFEKRLDLRQRFSDVNNQPSSAHPIRPYAIRSLSYIWNDSGFFDPYDSGLSGLAREYRHPLMDLRLIHYCLSLPPYPWCIKKHLIREAMRGILPEAVRTRPKAPLAGDPYIELLRSAAAQNTDFVYVASYGSNRYIVSAKAPPLYDQSNPAKSWLNMRAYSLNIWMKYKFDFTDNFRSTK